MKRISVAVILCALLVCTAAPAFAATPPEPAAHSALLMDAASGQILYEKNSHERLHPASVTKIMTLLLTMEAIDGGTVSLDEVITASEHASSMGGSQIYLEPGEQMTLGELLKAVTVASANDACVAISEHLAGSEESFVARMNERAAELGMEDTHFVNCTGLDADGHLTTAYDIALMSRELLKHDLIRNYTTIWMDSVRGGEFGLTNTNKLIRFYNGATGLKTGFTNDAGYCISATAERDGMELICVIMKSDTSPHRNADASALLNFGFANYAAVHLGDPAGYGTVPVKLGVCDSVETQLSGENTVILEKADASRVESNVEWLPPPTAPVDSGQILGYCTLSLDGQTLAKLPITAAHPVEKLCTGDIFRDLLQNITGRIPQ